MKRKILNRKKRKHDRDICEIYLNNHLYDFLRFCEIKIARASDHPCTIRDLSSIDTRLFGRNGHLVGKVFAKNLI